MYENVIRLADELMMNSTPEKPLWNVEVLLGHIKPGWNYIDGCMLKAALDMYRATNESKYIDFADDYVDYFVRDDGSILGYNKTDYNSDFINEGKVLFLLYENFGKEKYRKAIDELYDQLLSQPRTECGNFWHKQIYPNQIWLDGAYMVLPFYAEYETRYNQSKNIRDIFTMLTNIYNNMRDESTGLFYHGWDTARECFWADPVTGLSKNFWSRSIGWYLMALVDTIEQIHESQFYERETLIGHFRTLLDDLLKVSDSETGMLWQVTNQGSREGNYLETSSSAAFSYTLMKGSRLGYLPEYYYDHGKRVFDGIVENKLSEVEQKMVLSDVCLVAGLGVYQGRGDYKERDGTFEYYISEPRVNNDAKGVAPLLMALSEFLMKKNN